MSHFRDRNLSRHLIMQKVTFQGPEEFSGMGECKKELWVAGKMSWYLQRDCQSLVKEFSDGKLKQKGFFHSVRGTSSFAHLTRLMYRIKYARPLQS
jgi:hypothetical protein